MRWTFWLHCRPKDLVFYSLSSHDHSSFMRTKLTYMHPMSCQHLKCAFLSTLVRTPPVPNDHEVFPCSYSVHFCRLFRSLPTGKNLPSSVLWGLSLTCYCAACRYCRSSLNYASSNLSQGSCAQTSLSGLGQRKPDPDHISQVQRDRSVVEPSRSLAACAGRFDPAQACRQ